MTMIPMINKTIVKILPALPVSIVRKFAKRYVAGAATQDAVNTVKTLMEQNCCTTLTILGEHITEKEKTLQTVDEYLQLMQTIKTENLDSGISVKPTQVGLQIDFDFCRSNIETMVNEAASHGIFVRMDMEDFPAAGPTIDIYKKLRAKYDNIGIVLQAYLRRTLKDVRQLIAENVPVNTRLCKGIYVVPRKHAFKDPAIINDNYMVVLKELFEHGAFVGIATHDEKLVYHAMRLIEDMNIPKSSCEFQMLLGVDAELRQIILDAGYPLRVYVPFGSDWYDYSLRRLKENPDIAGYVIKNLISGT